MRRSNFHRGKGRRGFVLLEIILAVAIFSLGVMAIAMAVNNCLDAEIGRAEDQRARLLLENTMASIENGEPDADQTHTAKMDGMFTGLTLAVTNTPLNWQNENGQDLTDLNQIDVVVSWESSGQNLKKSLQLYVLRSATTAPATQ